MNQYLSFQTGIECMTSPPELDPSPYQPTKVAIIECNRDMRPLGTIFNTMPVTRPPVAMLYSLSDQVATQTVDRTMNYASSTEQGKCIQYTYLAGKILQYQFLPVVDEDVVDGTLAAN